MGDKHPGVAGQVQNSYKHAYVARGETENSLRHLAVWMLQAAVSISTFLLQRRRQLRASRLSVHMKWRQQSSSDKKYTHTHTHTHTHTAPPGWTHSYRDFLCSGLQGNPNVLTGKNIKQSGSVSGNKFIFVFKKFTFLKFGFSTENKAHVDSRASIICSGFLNTGVKQ
jgi:hypothetical protein